MCNNSQYRALLYLIISWCYIGNCNSASAAGYIVDQFIGLDCASRSAEKQTFALDVHLPNEFVYIFGTEYSLIPRAASIAGSVYGASADNELVVNTAHVTVASGLTGGITAVSLRGSAHYLCENGENVSVHFSAVDVFKRQVGNIELRFRYGPSIKMEIPKETNDALRVGVVEKHRKFFEYYFSPMLPLLKDIDDVLSGDVVSSRVNLAFGNDDLGRVYDLSKFIVTLPSNAFNVDPRALLSSGVLDARFLNFPEIATFVAPSRIELGLYEYQRSRGMPVLRPTGRRIFTPARTELRFYFKGVDDAHLLVSPRSINEMSIGVHVVFGSETTEMPK